ncbi:suppressor protein SRP40-like [Penaeus japonicus]|uniref:suppressor protein SRP40-like n=1 Tax=Penaeus japonicus TaxID=27405 RepID=UPI001C70CE50|nr:suppressor protein SRP40-like [Penaeus japonicus]
MALIGNISNGKTSLLRTLSIFLIQNEGVPFPASSGVCVGSVLRRVSEGTAAALEELREEGRQGSSSISLGDGDSTSSSSESSGDGEDSGDTSEDVSLRKKGKKQGNSSNSESSGETSESESSGDSSNTSEDTSEGSTAETRNNPTNDSNEEAVEHDLDFKNLKRPVAKKA